MVSQGLLRSLESLAKDAESIPEQRASPEFVSTPIRNLIAAIRLLKVLSLVVLAAVQNGDILM